MKVETIETDTFDNETRGSNPSNAYYLMCGHARRMESERDQWLAKYKRYYFATIDEMENLERENRQLKSTISGLKCKLNAAADMASLAG